MATLKLGKLPDRTPSKLTITLTPELKQTLDDYARLYRETYGQSETIAELVQHMLATFLSSDRAFVKARETMGQATE